MRVVTGGAHDGADLLDLGRDRPDTATFVARPTAGGHCPGAGTRPTLRPLDTREDRPRPRDMGRLTTTTHGQAIRISSSYGHRHRAKIRAPWRGCTSTPAGTTSGSATRLPSPGGASQRPGGRTS